MTHPTIEAACHKMGLEPEAGHGRYMPAAARVILSAQVSDAEVEAANDAWFDGNFNWRENQDDRDGAMYRMRAALTAARAKCLEEMEGCV